MKPEVPLQSDTNIKLMSFSCIFFEMETLARIWSSLGLKSLPKQHGLEIKEIGNWKNSWQFHSGVEVRCNKDLDQRQ